MASSLAAGNVENLPTSGKNASVGNAPRTGILAAYLAREGSESAPAALEGRLGWAQACGDAPDTERALRDLGSSWEFSLNAIKPYPCGIVFHAVIDASLHLRGRHGLTPEAIEQVVVKGNSLFLLPAATEKFAPRATRVSAFSTPRRSPSSTDGRACSNSTRAA